MESGQLPEPDVVFPVPQNAAVTYVKPTVKSRNIIFGDFTYFSGVDFESHVTHFYPDVYNDKLVFGKFCQIGAGVEFIMNGANHQMNCVSTFPFYIFEKWGEGVPALSQLPHKGDTVIGNDVWFGQNAVILPGVTIGDGAIVGLGSVVASDVEPYSVVAGNPAKVIRKRFDDELTGLLLQLRWWDLPITRVVELMPLLHNSDLELVKREIRGMVN